MIRDEVRQLVALGPLPDAAAEEAVIDQHEQALARVVSPVSIDEARALVGCFGPDDCFGLAWTLVHLIESAPQLPLDSEPDPGANEWLRTLWDRAH
jgi:hypothetical protein